MSVVSLTALPAETVQRLSLKLDAVVTGANGAAYLAVAGPLSELFGLEAALLRGVGAFLLAYAAVVWLIGSAQRINGALMLGVVIANAVWAIDSVALAVTGAGDPTTTGTVWMVMQAGVVAGFAVLQAVARRASLV